MRALRLSRPTTYADYLDAEGHSPRRHEFIDGVIVAMAGGSYEHNALAGRWAALLGTRLPKGCHYYSQDQRFWIAESARGRYADGSIICGKPVPPTHDRHAATNPALVIEVLSPSTQGDDAGDKRCDFQSLSSLKAYVLIHQGERRVQVYRRDDRGEWRLGPDVYKDGQSFELPEVTEPIPVAAVYDDILDERGHSLLT